MLTDGNSIVRTTGRELVLPAAERQTEDADPSPDRSGISEVFVNVLENHLYIRGYAFSRLGKPVVWVKGAGGQDIAPMRNFTKRTDLAKRFPGIDPNCGFEFHVPLFDGPRYTRQIEVLVRYPTGAEAILPVDPDKEKLEILAAVDIQTAAFNSVDHSIVIGGTLIGAACKYVLASIRLMEWDLLDPEVKFSPEVVGSKDGKRPDRRSFTARATSAIRAQHNQFQVFPKPGQKLAVSFRPPHKEYTVSGAHLLTEKDLRSAVGAIHSVRHSTESNLIEIRGAFLGPYTSGRVQLEVDGKPLKRTARLERDGIIVPSTFTRSFGAPFSDWTWCDELPLEAVAGKVVRAKLFSGSRLIGVAEQKVKAEAIENLRGALDPSYFVSAHEREFNHLVALAGVSSLEPTVCMIFPGDLFATFGGGPSRVIEMARYLTGMGYSVRLIDLANLPEEYDQVPEEFANAFAYRLGLPAELHDEFIALALDYMTREAGAERTRDFLLHALNDIDEQPTDLILRRAKPKFNALAAFLMAINPPDFVITNFAWTASIFDAVSPNVCKILDIHDVQHVRGKVHKAVTGEDNYITSLATEMEAIRKADYVLAIQADDKDLVIKESGRNNVIFCGHAKKITEAASAHDANHCMLFVGNKYPPNTIGLMQFLEKSWPYIRSRVPDATLFVVGTVADDLSDAPEGVNILGKVPDIDPIYEDVALVINPVEFGSGLNIKSVEALCHGRCLVTTDFGLRGLDVQEGEARNTPAAEMHEHIVELLLAPEERRRLEAGALAFARRALTPDKVFRELFNTMELRLYS